MKNTRLLVIYMLPSNTTIYHCICCVWEQYTNYY